VSATGVGGASKGKLLGLVVVAGYHIGSRGSASEVAVEYGASRSHSTCGLWW
jgi:hypothetical protein